MWNRACDLAPKLGDCGSLSSSFKIRRIFFQNVEEYLENLWSKTKSLLIDNNLDGLGSLFQLLHFIAVKSLEYQKIIKDSVDGQIRNLDLLYQLESFYEFGVFSQEEFHSIRMLKFLPDSQFHSFVNEFNQRQSLVKIRNLSDFDFVIKQVEEDSFPASVLFDVIGNVTTAFAA